MGIVKKVKKMLSKKVLGIGAGVILLAVLLYSYFMPATIKPLEPYATKIGNVIRDILMRLKIVKAV